MTRYDYIKDTIEEALKDAKYWADKANSKDCPECLELQYRRNAMSATEVAEKLLSLLDD